MRHLSAAAAAPASAPNGQPVESGSSRSETLVQSYRQLADVFHDILSEHSLDNLLERIADTLAELVPYDSLSIYQADEAQTVLTPVLARDQWADEILKSPRDFGQGITGWAALHREPVRTNQAHLDPRMTVVPGTPPDEPEALITVPLVARDTVKGALNIYRLGEQASFSDEEFELATRFADAAALALDNAQIRERLEHQAQTDSLTGLYNHRYFHERLRAELTRASRSRDSVGVLMLDIDDFKRVNDVYGHGTGDQVLRDLADLLRGAVRGSDVVCRLGGEEFGVIIASGDAGDAINLARRLTDSLSTVEFGPAGKITISVGVSQGPEHAMNPRELVACAEAAMMTSKARGKNQIVLYDEGSTERPESAADSMRDVRSIAHLKMLQGLAGKLNRLNDVREIGEVIADELRLLMDYHNCRVLVIDDDEMVPVAFRGQLTGIDGLHVDFPRRKVGEGITGREADHLKGLLEFTGAISEAAVREEIGNETVRATARLLAKDCALWLRDEHGDFRIAAHSEYDQRPDLRPMLTVTLEGEAVRKTIGDRNDPFVLGATEANRALPVSGGPSWPDIGLAPVRTEGCVDGFIIVRDPLSGQHSNEELLRLLGGISYQASVALQRAGSFENLEETFVSTVEALANALEANDEYTSSHTRWITDMALTVGRELGFDGPALKRLELGALFHDIGKIGVPTSILLKPGPLTTDERKIIEQHPELGERILEPIDRLAEVRTIVRSCHERWDGGGYPDGKSGEEIPIEARIVFVCDAFHAMTTDRPYRKRLSVEEACRRVREAAGTQFDPTVVDVFLSLSWDAPHADERLAS